ncbi:MAG: multiheme c-type cytochrome [Candidatus Hinthialibacter sp.]
MMKFFEWTAFFALMINTFAWSETITIFVSCKTLGRLEQCGCSTNIEGGLEARAGFLERARKEAPDAILADLGGFMPLLREKKKPEFLLPNEDSVNAAVGQTNLEGMKLLQYDVILCAPSDLDYDSAVLTSAFPSKDVFLCSDVESNGSWLSPYKIIQRKDIKIGFVGASSLVEKKGRINREFTILPAGESIPPIVKRLRQNEHVDAVVLLAHEPPPTVQRWLSNYKGPRIDLVIALDFGIRVEQAGDVYLTNAPGKGRALGKIVLDIQKGQGIQDVQYQRIPMYPSKYSNKTMRNFLYRSYAGMVDALQLNADPLEIHNNQENGYLGAKICMGCHKEEYEQWMKTRHASAFFELLEQTRHWVPECVRCHVTGFGHPEGFRQFPQSDHLMHVQCETCHGPGQRHVDEFGMGHIKLTPQKSLCVQCHTSKFSPQFDSMFDLYYKQTFHQE